MFDKIVLFEARPYLGLTGILLLLFMLLWAKNAPGLQWLSFNAARIIARQRTELATVRLQTYQTDHFVIKYDEKTKTNVPLVAEAAEKMYKPVTDMLAAAPDGKTTVILYPDSVSMGRAFGWDKDERAMGVYWAGTIRVLNPDEWITAKDKKRQFLQDGPMAHEFVHLLVDNISHGNYPRWFTEGVAQYVEKQVTGFELSHSMAYNDYPVTYYDFQILEAKYDGLDTGLAYRESLEAVEYIVDLYGQEILMEIMTRLGQGYNFPTAYQKATGQSFDDFARDFYVRMQKLSMKAS